MQKSVIDPHDAVSKSGPTSLGDWLDLDRLATVEITSEDPLFPIENALGIVPTTGWRAAGKGPQLIRLNFAEPIAIRRIHMHFIERGTERSQEFAVYAKSVDGELKQVIRQQFSFSPGGSTEEIEDYTVDLKGLVILELRIDPDRAHDPAHSQHFALLQSLRLA